MTDFPPLPIQIDSTMLTTYRSCPKKFFWEYVLNLRPKLVSIHLHAGGAFASALEVWRHYHYVEKYTSEDAQVPAIREFIRYWGDFVGPDDVKPFWRVLAALSSYMDNYPLHLDHLQPLKGDSFEYSFAIPTKTLHPSGMPFMFCGRIDLLASYTGMPAVVDEKTTTQLGPSFTKKWPLRGQFLGYLWAIRQIGVKATWAIIRGTAILKYTTEHLEVPQQYPEHLIETWAEELELTLQRMVADWEAQKFLMNFGDTCSSYSSCAFLTLCISKRPEIWFGDYGKNTWNPLLRNPIAKPETELAALPVSAALALAGPQTQGTSMQVVATEQARHMQEAKST